MVPRINPKTHPHTSMLFLSLLFPSFFSTDWRCSQLRRWNLPLSRFSAPPPPIPRRLLVPSPWIIIHKHAWSCGFHPCHRHKQAADLLPHARPKLVGKHKQLRSQLVKPAAKRVPHLFYVIGCDVYIEIKRENWHQQRHISNSVLQTNYRRVRNCCYY